MVGGNALRMCLKQGFVEYRFRVWEKRAQAESTGVTASGNRPGTTAATPSSSAAWGKPRRERGLS
jgi:hypothetical protein